MYRGLRETGYLPFYFKGYGKLIVLLPGIWDIVIFGDIDCFGNINEDREKKAKSLDFKVTKVLPLRKIFRTNLYNVLVLYGK